VTVLSSPCSTNVADTPYRSAPLRHPRTARRRLDPPFSSHKSVLMADQVAMQRIQWCSFLPKLGQRLYPSPPPIYCKLLYVIQVLYSTCCAIQSCATFVIYTLCTWATATNILFLHEWLPTMVAPLESLLRQPIYLVSATPNVTSASVSHLGGPHFPKANITITFVS
jgi:hypothetical protein